MLKRVLTGTFHTMSPKHRNRYVNEFADKQDFRDLDTLAQMRLVYFGLECKRIKYDNLIAENGLASGARA